MDNRGIRGLRGIYEGYVEDMELDGQEVYMGYTRDKRDEYIHTNYALTGEGAACETAE